MKPRSRTLQTVPLNIVGSNVFGRYPKISVEQTFNMIISDGWLVPFAGYQFQSNPGELGQNGRAIYASTRLGKMIVVIDNFVYTLNNNLISQKIGTINTYSGDVFIDENNTSQIAICDKANLWIYNWSTGAFTQASLPTDPATNSVVIPGYVTYQDGFFIVPNSESSNWFLSQAGDGTSWNWGTGNVPVFASIQTKPDNAVATLRFPGRGNLLLIFGKTVTELWFDAGNVLFPYTRSTTQSIDYGCLNPATIASGNNLVVWLGANEKSGPFILYTNGGDIQKISNDGIDFRLSQLNNPAASYGYLFRQDGHLLYVITFTDPLDNVSFCYDFNTSKFFTLTDENMNYHVARRVAFFNETYYFVSINDGNIYNMSTRFTDFDYGSNLVYEIPRVRVCKNFRLPDQSRFVMQNITFTIEQGIGQDNNANIVKLFSNESSSELVTTEGRTALIFQEKLNQRVQRVDMRYSRDGGMSYGSDYSKILNSVGNAQNRMNFWNLGMANDFVPQFRFYGFYRFVATDGLMSYYQ